MLVWIHKKRLILQKSTRKFTSYCQAQLLDLISGTEVTERCIHKDIHRGNITCHSNTTKV